MSLDESAARLHREDHFRASDIIRGFAEDEAVELARTSGGANRRLHVNGVLDRLARAVRGSREGRTPEGRGRQPRGG